MVITIIVLYLAALLFVFFYSLTQLDLIVGYLRKKKDYQAYLFEQENQTIHDWPFVTIQLPIYNELYVSERLLRSIAAIDYPKDKLEVQILDDSNDSTTQIIQETLISLGDQASNFELIRREERTGFKAGALKYGLPKAKGEFIAIFDADFLPKTTFLKRTIPHFFANDKVGVVQSRWEHINQNYSILTKAQAFALDAHFTIEQVGRHVGKHFINFNGTAGVWRKTCIEDAGNWQADTLTEDLDLSYRAQLKGWKFIYNENLGSPAELPASMNAWKSQQFRWNKGAAENVRKNIGKVIKAPLPTRTKIHALFHLLNSSVLLAVITMAILSIPILLIKDVHGEKYKLIFQLASFFVSSFFILLSFYGVSFYRLRQKEKGGLWSFIHMFPIFLCFSLGMSLHNAIAVLEGYLGKKSAFIRTPKFNIINKKDKWTKNKYRIKTVSPLTFVEVLLSLYFLGGVIFGISIKEYDLLFLHTILSIGFGMVSFYSVKHANT